MFLPKIEQTNPLYCYETSGQHVFVHFLEEIEDTKKTFRNYLTFKPPLSYRPYVGESIKILTKIANFELSYD